VTDSRENGLRWHSEDEFEIDGIVYACRPIHDFFESTPERFCLRKPPELVRRLELLIRESGARTIVELGVFEGGSTGFIAQATRPERLVCFDLESRRDALEQMVAARDLEEVVRPHWEVDQADGEALRSIVREELGERSIDLVIDDASHLLGPTRASFDALFPMLRPGGLYLIEDWAWAHGITNAWPWETPLSVLVFELVLTNASRPEAVERVDVDRAWTQVTRGPRELGDDFSVLEHCGERGRMLLPPAGAGADPALAPGRAAAGKQGRGRGRGLSRWARRPGSRDVG
jgi:predicted O-methyltransferase YrrM